MVSLNDIRQRKADGLTKGCKVYSEISTDEEKDD